MGLGAIQGLTYKQRKRNSLSETNDIRNKATYQNNFRSRGSFYRYFQSVVISQPFQRRILANTSSGRVLNVHRQNYVETSDPKIGPSQAEDREYKTLGILLVQTG